MFKGHTVGRLVESHISGDADTLTHDDGAQMWCQRVDVSGQEAGVFVCSVSLPHHPTSNMLGFLPNMNLLTA